MLPDRVSNPGPLTYESGTLLIALRGPVYSGNRNKDSFLLSSHGRASDKRSHSRLVPSLTYNIKDK